MSAVGYLARGSRKLCGVWKGRVLPLKPQWDCTSSHREWMQMMSYSWFREMAGPISGLFVWVTGLRDGAFISVVTTSMRPISSYFDFCLLKSCWSHRGQESPWRRRTRNVRSTFSVMRMAARHGIRRCAAGSATPPSTAAEHVKRRTGRVTRKTFCGSL